MEETEYNANLANQLRALIRKYAELKNQHSKELVSTEDYLASCSILLIETYHKYTDFIYEVHDNKGA